MRLTTIAPILLLVACAHEQRQALSFPVIALGMVENPFVGEDQVEVQLDEAWIVLGDLRLEAPASTAAKHPGHDFSGATSCELLGSWELNLLADPQALGDVACLDGELATGRLVLTGDPVVGLVGTATLPDSTQRAFRFELVLDDEITGVPVEAILDAEAPPAQLVLEISPATVLAWVDWDSLDSDRDDVLTMYDDLLGNTVPFGVVSTASYTITITE